MATLDNLRNVNYTIEKGEIMGCDIHVYTEYKLHSDKYGSGKWINIDNWECELDFLQVNSFYDDRSYLLFAMLADVRNENEITPIIKPRGLPSDMSWGTRYGMTSYDDDLHSYSHLKLSEIRKYLLGLGNDDLSVVMKNTLSDFIDKLAAHVIEKGYTVENEDSIRIVFGFDS